MAEVDTSANNLFSILHYFIVIKLNFQLSLHKNLKNTLYFPPSLQTGITILV